MSKRRTQRHKPPALLEWSGILHARSVVMLALLMSFLFTGLAVVYTTHENRYSFNELQELKEQANQFQVQWGQLLIEQSTFGLGGTVELKATQQLQMKIPELSEIVMVGHD